MDRTEDQAVAGEAGGGDFEARAATSHSEIAAARAELAALRLRAANAAETGAAQIAEHERPEVAAIQEQPDVEGRIGNLYSRLTEACESLRSASRRLVDLGEGLTIETKASDASAPGGAIAETLSAAPLPPPASDDAWPPPPLNDYWLPQALRDYLIESCGEPLIDSFAYLFSVIELYAAETSTFHGSPVEEILFARARRLACEQPAGEPDVTVIIPVYNNLVYTLTAIVSVLELADQTRYEILVGDDCSTDATAAVIGAIGPPVRHLRHTANLGFLNNCNTTAEHARGAYLVLLNNDVIVLPGWLDGLRKTFDARPNVGLVGSKLINGDGTLQEAGGLVWRGGAAWNYGRGQDPRLPEFNYVKEADYCSGASIALPTKLWRALGGFDPLFAPAYCEDSDLCMRVRAAGKKVLFQPSSQLVHHEGRSHGRDTTSGVKAFQPINERKLKARWGEAWDADNFEIGENVFLARDRSANRPHILIVDHYVPQWDQDAGSRTMYQYIRMFVDLGFHVTFWPDNLYRDPVYAPILQQIGVEVIYTAKDIDNFSGWIANTGQYINYVLLSRPYIATKYIDQIRAHSAAKILYYGHDLHYKRMITEYGVTGDFELISQIENMKTTELEVCGKVDLYLYPGSEEIDTLRAELGGAGAGAQVPINVFPPEEVASNYGDDLVHRDQFSLLFVGGFAHGPNADGVIWFVNQVMPRLIAEDPRYELTIVGSSQPDKVAALASSAVHVIGRVTDDVLAELYAGAGAAIAPLRYGGGVKGKVIEALAKGAPVVTTSIGAQGIPDPERFILIGDDPDSFARAIIDVSARSAETTARVNRGLDFIRSEYTREGLGRRLARVIPELAAAPLANRP